MVFSFSNVFLSTVVLVHFVNASMIINRACLVKSCPGFWKCSSYGMDFVFFTSFRWLYNLSFNGVSNFQHIDAWDKAYMKLNIYLFSFYNLHGALWRMFLLLLALLKLLVDTICLQHIFPIWLRHGPQCPAFDTFLIIFWLFNSLFPPIRSFKFLFRLNVRIGLSANIFPNLLFVDKMFQLSWMTLRTSGRFRLYFVVNLIVLSTLLSLYTSRSFLFTCLDILELFF